MKTQFSYDQNGRQIGLSWPDHGGLDNPDRPVTTDSQGENIRYQSRRDYDALIRSAI